jgi:hypothetical protein
MGFSRGPSLVSDSLSLVLDAATSRSWTPGSSIWYDISGNGNNATAYGSPSTQDTGTNIQNIYLDGTNDYFQITANQTSLDFRNGYTVGILMYHTFTSGRRVLWDQAYGGYGTWNHEQGSFMRYYYGGAGGNANPYTNLNSPSTPTSTWSYMVLTRTPLLVTWYSNGSQVAQQSNAYAPMPVTSANIRIGVGYTGVYWMGNITLVHAYNRGLTAAEVLQNYNVVKARFT